MKIKTSELKGAALDWAVAKAVGERNVRVCAPMNTGEPICPPFVERLEEEPCPGADDGYMSFRPSTDWSQGGPLMDARVHALIQWRDGTYDATVKTDTRTAVGWAGDTILIAAMRAIVAADLGDEVDVPEELLS